MSNQSVEGCIYYFDYWKDVVNHSALHLFFKQSENASLVIDDIQLDTDLFSSTLSADRRSACIIPDGNKSEESCIDFQITFDRKFSSVKAYSFEMVYIPTGKFFLGGARSFEDRNTINTSDGSLGAPLNAFFKSGQKGTFNGAFLVDSEDEIPIGDCDGCLRYLDAQIRGVNTFSGDGKGLLAKEFPKGYNAFYQMRYELTEQEYCDFLNSLNPQQASQRIKPDEIFQGGSRQSYGNFIVMENGKYTTAKPDQPCSFLSWNDCLAFSDWAGMRIMTELEFEKSCRGFDTPKFREYAWGSSEIDNGFFLDKRLFDCETGSSCVDGNVHVNLLGFSNFKDVCGKNGSDPTYIGCRNLSEKMTYRGPLATGIHSKGKNDLNRQNSGGGYFGSLDLSGNLREPVIPVGDTGSRTYIGSTGDGWIAEDGKANNTDWYYADEESLVFGYRGGCWAFHENHARIADRFNVYRKGINVRKPYSGFRGVKN
ncbi:MAG: SUMF1/EgtB/PvdO family nonheme iron enzyme [Bacteroidota bacterium]